MLFKKVKSEGLAHFSYIVGDQTEAAVIDPRRDIDIYLEIAKKEGMKIKYIFETHRNEDYIIGSRALAKRSNAEIFHADGELDYQYGQLVEVGKDYQIGRLKIEALHTPGHTKGSHSYLLKDYDQNPWMLFSGDILFAGDVGRIDFYGEDNIPKIAALLYDSLYNKILPLGEEVILCPAHGAGSVCGSQIADRELTTIGIEKRSNPYLQFQSKDDFINEVGKMEAKPKYFETMEAANLNPASAKNAPFIPALSPKEFEKEMKKEDTVVIDIRSDSDYAASHIPDSVFLWEDILSGFVGWFLENNKRILLVNNGDYPEKAVSYLFRMGFENLVGYLARGMLSWHMAAKSTESTAIINVAQLCNLLDTRAEAEYLLLDIRKEEEKEEEGYIDGALEIPLTVLQANLVKYAEEIDRGGEIYIFCGSGMRSMTAASLLENKVENKVKVVLGGLNACSSTSCPIKIEE